MSATLRRLAQHIFSIVLILTSVRQVFATTGRRQKKSGPLLFLANGPSLMEDLRSVRLEDYESVAVVNHFATSGIFADIKPSLYFLQDTYWFRRFPLNPRESLVIETLAHDVSWPLKLCVPQANMSSETVSSVARNPNVQVEPLPPPSLALTTAVSLLGALDEVLLHRLWRHGLGAPPMENIAATGIFASHRMGYNVIDVCGLDMSMLDGLGRDADGKPLFLNRHFYGEEKLAGIGPSQAIPALSNSIFTVAKKFRTFDLVARFLTLEGAQVVNRTQQSRLDSLPIANPRHPKLP